MKSRISFVLMAAAVVMAAVSLPGCPQLLALLASPTPTPEKNASLGGGNAYRIELVAPLGQNIPQ